MAYELRFFFDAGSGICLWSGNAEARERFGYPVDHRTLPLSENTQRFLTHLMAWYDTSIDWSDPGGTEDFWTREELARFAAEATKGLQRVRQELPAGFIVTDDRKT